MAKTRAWNYSFPYSWGYSWGNLPAEEEGAYKWAHLVMYGRQWVRPFDIEPATAAPGDDRDTS